MQKPSMCLMNKAAHSTAPYSVAADLDEDASIHTARNLLISELPGAAFSIITLIYVVASLIALI